MLFYKYLLLNDTALSNSKNKLLHIIYAFYWDYFTELYVNGGKTEKHDPSQSFKIYFYRYLLLSSFGPLLDFIIYVLDLIIYVLDSIIYIMIIYVLDLIMYVLDLTIYVLDLIIYVLKSNNLCIRSNHLCIRSDHVCMYICMYYI